jgi:hypothetical protein
VEEFMKGSDQRAYDLLMGLVNENNARAENVLAREAKGEYNR